MKTPLRVLIIEDSEDDAQLLVRELRRGGFEPAYERVETADTLRAALTSRAWEVVLSDYSMPHLTAPQALDLVRQFAADVPFLLVSGTIGEELAVALLKAGAQDFIGKANLARLVPAVERELRQAEVNRERRRAEEQVRLQGTALAAAANAVLITDRDGKIQWVNAAFTKGSGYTFAELIGQTPRLLKSGQQGPAFYADLWQTILAARVWDGELVEQRKDGTHYVVHQTVTPLQDERGTITHFVAIQEDITARKQAEARVEYLAYHDALTALPNRALFEDRLTHGIAQARRDGSMLAVMFLDLDQFKMINDTLGHVVGDQFLRAVAERLRNSIRATDTVARLGGDEFGIIQTDLSSAEGAAKLAGKLLEVLARPLVLSGREIRTTGSLGITLYPTDTPALDELLKNADLALYRAKGQGRNRYDFYTPALNAEMMARLALETELDQALAHGEIMPYYQPEVDLRSGRLIGMEALARWQHPKRGLLMPATFVPVAEESSLIRQLSRSILQQGCAQNQIWQASYPPARRLAVNISAALLRNGDLLETVVDVLQHTGMDPRALELELTETALMTESDKNTRTMKKLRQMGILLSVDDFGTGYSSLSYLRRLPVHKLKIDQSFLRGLPEDRDSVAIVRAIIDLGHRLGLRVIAEGVEKREQMVFLYEQECDEGQGFYFSRPLPAEDFAALLGREERPVAEHDAASALKV